MESLTHEFTIEIGVIRYTFDIEFNYNPGTNHLDPTEGEDAELDSWSFDGLIYAENIESGAGYFVSSKSEIQMIREWIDIHSLFNQALL